MSVRGTAVLAHIHSCCCIAPCRAVPCADNHAWDSELVRQRLCELLPTHTFYITWDFLS